MHTVDYPALLRQVFAAAVALPAQIVSLQKLQGQMQGKGTLPTIQSYLDILGQSFLVSAIYKYSGSGLRTNRSSPKLIIHDNAFMRAFEIPIYAPLSPEKKGRYFENAVGARFIEAGWQVFYWKDRDHEADFVVLGPQGQKWAIEVKSSNYESKDLNGIRKFCSIHPDFSPRVICLTECQVSEITHVPVEGVLSLSREMHL
ncbi:MAG: DUF4143 domain-containing protein [Pseudomonadota bacterium]